ncbi:MAG: hypothetical protein WKF97_25440 [Chitinophagaceae bacterium]
MTRLRLTPFLENEAALGVFILKKGSETYFSHGGSNEGFRCQYLGSITSGNGVIVMVNSDNGAILTGADGVIEKLILYQNGREMPAKKIK